MDPKLRSQLPQNPIQPPLENPSPDGALRFAKYLWIFLVILVGTTVIGSTAYLLNRNQARQISTVQSSPTPTVDPTANWKTQTNKDYNFSFRYSSKFTVKEEKKTYKEVPNTTYYDYTFSTGTLIQDQPDFSGFTITVTPTKGKTINQTFSGAPSGFGDSTISVSSIPPAQGSDEAAKLINAGNAVRVYRVGENFFQVVTFQNYNLLPDKSDDVMKYFDQILSTLKFTDPTANWKTFENSKFTMKYPSNWIPQASEFDIAFRSTDYADDHGMPLITSGFAAWFTLNKGYSKNINKLGLTKSEPKDWLGVKAELDTLNYEGKRMLLSTTGIIDATFSMGAASIEALEKYKAEFLSVADTIKLK